MKRQTRFASILSTKSTDRRRTLRQRLRGVESLEPRTLMAVSIGDYVWNDLNFDGLQNESPSEGVNGVVVTLYTSAGAQVGLPTQTTNNTSGDPGYYSFNDIAPGDYYVVFAAPSGRAFTKSLVGSDENIDSNANRSGRTPAFTLGNGVPNLSIDAGLVPTASVGTFVWWDVNSDGLQADIEGGIEGATVRLLQNGSQIDSQVTDEGGQYFFTNLAPGAYQIQFDRPLGFEVASPADVPSNSPGRNDKDDSDGLGPSLITAEFTLAPGERNLDVDQGFNRSAKVGNYVWRDVNNNGVQDEAARFGINGVTVTLFTGAGVQVGVPALTANDGSGNPGYYQFSGLAPGQYYVQFTAPADQVFTTPLVGSTSTDSNAEPTGRTATFSLGAGVEELSIDAGLRPIDLSLTSFVTDTTPSVNATVTYSVTVSNPVGFSGATGVTVSDVLPPGLTYISDNSGGNYNSTTRTWNVGTVAPGGSALLQVVATVPTGGTKANVVQVQTADQPDIDSTPGNAPGVREDEDFSLSITASANIGNYVWRDVNNDGVQNEASVFGVNGATVRLFTSAGVQVGLPVLTGNDLGGNPGYYQFNDINPGDYYIVVTPPPGQVFTTPNAGLPGTPATDSNVDSSGRSNVFTLVSGVDDLTIDAGIRSVDLSLTNTVSNPAPRVGTNVTYTLTVTNASGFSSATDVTVQDILPAGMTFVSSSGVGAYDSGTGTWTIGTIAPGANASLQIVATVTSGGTKSNLAQIQTVAQADFDSTPGNAPGVREDDDATSDLTPTANIGNYVWRDVNNDGIQNEAASFGINGVTVTLFTSAGTQVGAPTITANNGINPGFYSFNDIAPGSYYVVVSAPAGQVFTTPFAGLPGTSTTDSNVDSDGKSNTFTLQSGIDDLSIDAGLRPIDLSLTKTISDLTPPVGSNVTYTISVTNSAGFSTATNVTVQDLLPTGMSYVSDNGGGSYNNSTGVWTIPSIAPGGVVSLQVVATVTDGGAKSNTSQIQTAGQPDLDSTPGNAPGIREDDDVSSSLTPSATIGNYVWRDVNNDGIQNEAASFGVNGVTVTLFTSAGVQVGNPVVTANNGVNPGFYSFPDIDPGSYYVVVTAPIGQVFTTPFAALPGTSATDSNVDSAGKSNTFSLTSGVDDLTIDAGLRPIDLGLIKTVSDSTPRVGTNVTYTITVTNGNGLSAATGVTVQDALPAGMTFVSSSGTGTYDSATGTWTVGTVASGESVTLQIVATVTTGGVKSNTTQVQTANQPDFDSTPGNAPGVREDDDVIISVTPSASIGNYVWRDVNGDGIQNEAAASGLNGVTVTLFTSAGAQVGAPVVTANDGSGNPGFYLFNDIDPGSYYVKVNAPADLTFTTQFATTATPATDSNVDATGQSNTFTLASGVDDLTIDAGLKTSQTCVVLDFNGNTATSGTLGNVRTFTSGPISVNARGFSRDRHTGAWANAYLGSYGGGLGVTDSAEGTGAGDSHTVDNLDGRDNYILFAFNQAVVLDSAFLGYVVNDSDLTVWIGTVPNAFTNHQTLSDSLLASLYTEGNWTTLTTARLADLNANGIAGNVIVIAADVTDTSPEDRFKLGQLTLCTPGTQQPASLGNFVWHDLNANGIQEVGEPGIHGASVTLTGGGADGVINGVGDTVVSTTTNSTGNYSFTGLVPGTQYRAAFAMPAGYTTASPRKLGTDNALDSDGPVSDIVILGSGQNLTSIDAGFYRDVRVGNFVWNDLDRDGFQDSTEGGIGGVVVNLTGTNGSGATVNLSTTTASNGSYSFSSLPPGTYRVSVAASNFSIGQPLSGFVASPTLVGTDRALDSNVNSSETSPATLVSGSSDTTVDFGYYLDTTRVCVNLFLEGNTATSGTAGNVITFASGSIAAKASAFSRDSAGSWRTAYLGRFAGGLGVTDTSEGSGAGNAHTVDNLGRNNYVLFAFSQGVTVDTAFLGYVAGDSDIRVWIGNATNAFNSNPMLSDAFLAGLGFSEVNVGAGSTRTADINAGNLTGNILVISANTGEASPNDQFKIAELSLCAVVPNAQSGTKFFTVDDDTNKTFKYNSVGTFTHDFAIVSADPRGITSNVSGSNVWIADTNGRIFNYTSDGAHVANWSSRITGLQGVTTNGTHIWTVSDVTDRVYYYPNGTTYANGSAVNPTSSFALNFYNKNPTDLTTDGRFIWVVNEGNVAGGGGDMVFKYTVSGSYLGRWQLDSANARPTGITVDPAGGNKLWIVDNSTDRIYEYSGATGCVSGGLVASRSYALAAGNTNPQGIADPPGPGEEALNMESSLVVNEQYVNVDVNPSFNSFNAADVNSDGIVSPIDALLVINRLNALRQGKPVNSDEWIYDDVSNDRSLTPLDALLVINKLNSDRRASVAQPLEAPVTVNAATGNAQSNESSNTPAQPGLGAGEGEGMAARDAYFAGYSQAVMADTESENSTNRRNDGSLRNHRRGAR